MNYKKGDIVATDSGSCVMILKESTNHNNAPIYAGCNLFDVYINVSKGWFNRLATIEEKERLFRLLLEKGYTWDEENLELIQEL